VLKFYKKCEGTYETCILLKKYIVKNVDVQFFFLIELLIHITSIKLVNIRFNFYKIIKVSLHEIGLKNFFHYSL
jgi:hypothetical protein